MAAPASSVAETMSGASELGKRWRSITRQREAPRHCAASTNSCSRNDSTALRARRAALVHSSATRMIMMLSKPGPANFDSTKSKYDARDRVNRIDQAHKRVVEHTANVSSEDTDESAENHGADSHRQADRERNSAAMHDAHPGIPPQLIRAQPMLCGRHCMRSDKET